MNDKMLEIINILEKVPEKFIKFNPPASKKEIAEFEKKWNISLPIDYVELLMKYNGINLMGNVLLGVPSKNGDPENLDSSYKFEHSDCDNPMPLNLIPFCPDGFGNHYCFDIQFNKIVFWQHDCDYSEDSPEVVYNTLAAMLQEIFIEWTILDDEDLSIIMSEIISKK